MLKMLADEKSRWENFSIKHDLVLDGRNMVDTQGRVSPEFNIKCMVSKALEKNHHIRYGGCKIAAPQPYSARPTLGYEENYLKKIKIMGSNAQQQVFEESRESTLYMRFREVEPRDTTLLKFSRRVELLGQYLDPESTNMEKIFEEVYSNIYAPQDEQPVYAIDVEGSLFEPGGSSYDPTRLNDILKEGIPGVTEPYLYIGSGGSFFSVHKEDMDLLSIGYLHLGAPKVWIVIPAREAGKFEKAVATEYKKEAKECVEFLRHKTYLPSPWFLRKNKIEYSVILQKQGDFVVTFPAAYHFGFNLGFNIAEAVNYATKEWLPFGVQARACECSITRNAVTVDMEPLLQEYVGKEDADGYFLLKQMKEKNKAHRLCHTKCKELIRLHKQHGTKANAQLTKLKTKMTGKEAARMKKMDKCLHTIVKGRKIPKRK